MSLMLALGADAEAEAAAVLKLKIKLPTPRPRKLLLHSDALAAADVASQTQLMKCADVAVAEIAAADVRWCCC